MKMKMKIKVPLEDPPAGGYSEKCYIRTECPQNPDVVAIDAAGNESLPITVNLNLLDTSVTIADIDKTTDNLRVGKL